MAKSPEEVAEKWARRTGQASQDYADGVARVTEAPGRRAAAKKDKWMQGIQRAASEGTWERRVGAVSLEQWKQAAMEKGASRFASGASAAQPKMQRFMQEFLPAQESITNRVRNMPDGTVEQRVERSRQQQLETSKLKGRFGSR